MKILTAACILSAVAVVATPALAVKRGNDHWERQERLQAEWDKAREVGGYNDPATALKNIAAGEATEKDITPGVNHIQDVPGHEGVLIYQRSD